MLHMHHHDHTSQQPQHLTTRPANRRARTDLVGLGFQLGYTANDLTMYTINKVSAMQSSEHSRKINMTAHPLANLVGILQVPKKTSTTAKAVRIQNQQFHLT